MRVDRLFDQAFGCILGADGQVMRIDALFIGARTGTA